MTSCDVVAPIVDTIMPVALVVEVLAPMVQVVTPVVTPMVASNETGGNWCNTMRTRSLQGFIVIRINR